MPALPLPEFSRRLGLLAALAALFISAAAFAFPRPNAVPQRWQLRFEPGDLRLHIDEDGQAFWYFTYKVTNLTGEDRIWAPEFTLYADNGDITPSGQGVPAAIQEQLLGMLNNEFLRQQNEVIGDIKIGAAHAIEGLVVWRARKLDNVNQLSMFISGISGDTADITTPGGNKFVLRKTMQRDYLIPGNPVAIARRPMEFMGERWIFR